jgi:hypothetical protein
MKDQCPVLCLHLLTHACCLFRIFVVSSPALASQRRYKTSGISTTFITMKKDQSFKKAWLSDISTYPLLIALGGGVFMAGGVFISMIANSPDVKLVNDRKHATLRNWGLRP